MNLIKAYKSLVRDDLRFPIMLSCAPVIFYISNDAHTCFYDAPIFSSACLIVFYGALTCSIFVSMVPMSGHTYLICSDDSLILFNHFRILL